MEISNEIWIILYRSILTIIILLIITKILGKKQISQLTLYDYIVGITIGSIAADSIIALNENIVNGLIAIIIFGVFGYIFSCLEIKSSKMDHLLNGKPVILMSNGKFNFENLKSNKITISKIIEEARLKGIFDMNLINYAILETSGQISFLPKEEYQSSNTADFKTDIKTKKSKQTMCSPIIVDGKIDLDTLNNCDKDIKWLKNEMKKLDIHNLDKITLATLDEKGKVSIFESN